MKRQHRAVLGVFTLMLVATTCLGAWVVRCSQVTIDGVDQLGNPSTANCGTGSGKTFKDLNSGIVVQISCALVTNEYGAPRIFADRGLTLIDPETDATLPSTNDLEVVAATRWNRQYARACQICVFDPRYTPNL